VDLPISVPPPPLFVFFVGFLFFVPSFCKLALPPPPFFFLFFNAPPLSALPVVKAGGPTYFWFARPACGCLLPFSPPPKLHLGVLPHPDPLPRGLPGHHPTTLVFFQTLDGRPIFPVPKYFYSSPLSPSPVFMQFLIPTTPREEFSYRSLFSRAICCRAFSRSVDQRTYIAVSPSFFSSFNLCRNVSPSFLPMTEDPPGRRPYSSPVFFDQQVLGVAFSYPLFPSSPPLTTGHTPPFSTKFCILVFPVFSTLAHRSIPPAHMPLRSRILFHPTVFSLVAEFPALFSELLKVHEVSRVRRFCRSPFLPVRRPGAVLVQALSPRCGPFLVRLFRPPYLCTRRRAVTVFFRRVTCLSS